MRSQRQLAIAHQVCFNNIISVVMEVAWINLETDVSIWFVFVVKPTKTCIPFAKECIRALLTTLSVRNLPRLKWTHDMKLVGIAELPALFLQRTGVIQRLSESAICTAPAA